jgi:hypothetical protein
MVQGRANDRSAALVALYTLRWVNCFQPTMDEARMIDAPKIQHSVPAGQTFLMVRWISRDGERSVASIKG